MSSNVFEGILQELGKAWNLPNLTPDQNQACLLRLSNDLKIQIELNSTASELVIASELGFVPSGAYRKELFYQALKVNGLPPPYHGVLAYSIKASTLVLFMTLPIKELNGSQLYEMLQPFIQKASIWQQAILHGEIPSLQSQASTKGGGIFSLFR